MRERTRRKLLQETLQHNSQNRLEALRHRFASIPDVPPLERIERMAEATVLACVDHMGNSSVMVRGLVELPDAAADIYRAEIGAIEALWNTEIATDLPPSPFRTRIAVHLVPYAAHACMSFGLWLAALRHSPATAQGHARHYVEGIMHVARAILGSQVGQAFPPAQNENTN